MLALISPAKKMDFESDWNTQETTQPDFLDQSKNLVSTLKQLPQSKIKSLMKISDSLAELNYNRFQRFQTPFTKENARPAALAFRGDTYVGLDADSCSQDDLLYAKDHLGILSGLYGILRPLDLIQAYRLEMGTKLANDHGEDLYDFWDETISNACNERVKNHKDKTIVSLASNEYIKAVKPKALKSNFITCHFKEIKNGAPKTIGLFAKRARGTMARYIIQNRIETVNDLKGFKEDGYAFESTLSDDENLVFLRDQSA